MASKLIKALTIRQPWASLIAIGAKQYETRSWSTGYRGPLVIHASKGFSNEERAFLKSKPFHWAFQRAGYREPFDLPLGAAVCVVDLVDVLRVETVRGKLEGDEKYFGNYADGRFAWKMANVRLIPFPIKVGGSLGLWDWKINIPGVLEGVN